MNTSFLLAILFAIALGPQLLALEVSVEADKLRVKPGDPVNLDVLVKGLPAGQTADVVCRITSGVDTEEANLTGKTDAAGMARFSFVPKKEFGYGATATARAGAESATASEVFASATNAYAVAVDYRVPEVYGQDVLPDGSAAPEGPLQNAELKTRIAAAIARFRDLTQVPASLEEATWWFPKTLGNCAWINDTEIKPGAKVIWQAGSFPAIMTGIFGKGRVAAITTPMLGEPSEPFWVQPAWKDVLAEQMRGASGESSIKH